MRGLAVCVVISALSFAGGARADDSDALPLGDADRGARIYKKCAACHQVGPDAVNRSGPHLNGIFDRRAADIEGFRYSKGIRRAREDGLVWDLARLDAYLENPKALVTGTQMNFRGLKSARDRADVLAFLRGFSDSPSNIPEAAPTAIPREVDLPPELLALVGDVDYGEYLASECTSCHQRDDVADGIPMITGWPTEDFVIALHAYKRKIRPHPVMQMMTSRLSDEEIAALAAYFGGLE